MADNDAADRELRHPLFARLYDRVLSKEGTRMRQLRAELLRDLRGRVVEIGPGNGTNFGLYPPTVKDVKAFEPNPYLRKRAVETANAHARVPITLEAATADALPIDDGWADAVVCSLVLCSVADQAQALREIRRVLRPEGELVLLEHVGAENRIGQALLRAAEATFWPRLLGNCHPTRNTLAAVREAGFDTAAVSRGTLQAAPADPPLPHIWGIARRIS